MDYNQGQKKDRKSLLLAALAILALLNVVLIYFFYKEREKNKEQETVIAAKTEEVVAAKMKLDSISAQLDAKIAEIQQLGGQVDSLVSLKQQLEKDKAALRNASSAASVDISKYKQKIANYEAILVQKDSDIAKLKEELGIVTAQNQELSTKVTGLEGEKASLQRTFEDSVGQLSNKNRELAEKVTIASALKAEKIAVNAVSSKGKERDGGAYKAKRIDKLKVDFDLAANPISPNGEREVYLRILDPEGAVMADMATGSGTFVYSGRETVYTAKQTLNYSNEGSQGSIIYSRGGIPLKKGEHTIELYCQGFRIGSTTFKVR
jgi:outer membrane murein-binding lipoprotein Lpp